MACSKLLVVSILVLYWCLCITTNATHVSHDGRAITIDGQRRIIISGSIHYPRSTSQMWSDLIRKAKEGGVDAIETYVFWNAHEPLPREYDFSGNLDLIRFLKTIQDEGLYAVLRIGPYVCAEWNYGGFPVWLHNIPGIELRTANTAFMNEMQTFTTKIVNMVKEENLFAVQGGPIILAQIENEYGNVISSYGDAGKDYINWCAKMATSLDIGVPWIMCQEDDAPQPMINTCNGWYCDAFTPNNPNSPKMWTENWTGWFKNWGGLDPKRTAEDVAFAVAKFFQRGGTFQNYYMYHGGTNFGRTAGGPYITTSYDYDAPLDEYGNLNQPKYGHLKELHDVLHSMEKILTYGNITDVDFGNAVAGTIYSTSNGQSCIFVNSNTTVDAEVVYEGRKYNIPAWSASILSDCKQEVYNTAKVNTQTWTMEKHVNEAENEPAELKWVWRPEIIDDLVLRGDGRTSAKKLIDQKVAEDVSDYLWYMTNLFLDKNDPIWCNDMSLRVNATGQVLHAYVNGEYIGTESATYGVFNYVFDKKIKLNPGPNKITLLSATIGFQNYGPKFDVVQNGIPGPVVIVGKKGEETIIKDLSTRKWYYKVGLDGFDRKFYTTTNSSEWRVDDLPISQRMTWYKTTFKAPLGDDPVSLDLEGLGKGYHVPRSFLVDGENELVLFEEYGGNPLSVNFQTMRVGTVCGNAYENKTMLISCDRRPISSIRFASFGDVQGSCGSFAKGSCQEQTDALSIVEKACVGKEICSIEANEAVFGSTSSCKDGVTKRLVAEAVC
ncbi:hypothetical protein L6452_03742 [Arctium lappa]|uniref:Uncharacterized protein n=1 Tax=Arctium lappa TaxID=4217 RepID=A0ACB9FMI1_ARCLA|nr:hypothetical protein L6452_03742 [Arctium lappa]